jgi:uncharacterized membrane protein YbhN (UPF0104 family)
MTEPSQRAGRAAWITGLVLLLALIVLVSRFGEGRALATLLRDAFAAHPAWLALAAGLQLGTYGCAAAVWQRALARSGFRVRVRTLLPLGVAKLFADQALPSAGLSGTLLVVRALVRRGVPRGPAVAAMLAGVVSFYVAYGLSMVASLVVLGARQELHPALLVLGAVFAVLATGVPLGILWLRGRGVPEGPRWWLRLPGAREARAAIAEAPRDAVWSAGLAVETVLLQLGIFALDAATLSVMLRAVEVELAPQIAFASFVVASVVATLAWVPGGLGTFEGTCVAMLSVHQVALQPALAAVLLLRGFTFWLPMAPGLWIARREMIRPPAAKAPPDGSAPP